MDDVDRLLAETMHRAVDGAPSEAGLLQTVHDRAHRYRRRRVVTRLSAVALVVVVGVPVAAVITTRPDPAVAPPVAVPTVSASPSTEASPSPTVDQTPSSRPPSSPRSSPPSSPATATADRRVTLVDGWTAPTFPYTLPAKDGMTAPRASMDGGKPIAFFEATELRHHADVTVTVSGARPTFTTTATEQPMRVRGKNGTFRTVDVSPAKQLTLYWRESSTRWIQLATDDTYTPEQVVSIADSLSPASIRVLPPFDLGLSPAGLVADSVTASRMTFRTPSSAPGDAAFRTVLREQRRLTGVNRKVNGDDAVLTRRDGRVTLTIDVTYWEATLEVTVDDGLTISDSDLLRYAEGVTILNRSNPE
ncbi:hypothetical protein [Micromonospora sp. SH-82]|uniref:hypothetical protein n=1 Tax=Micromonospora sp. SH-82 TaxID=3132938 RepID=UPI003EBE8AFD